MMRQMAVCLSALVMPALGFAQASCSAQNDRGDTCSITCAVGQAAVCSNAVGSGTPSCECQGSPSDGSAVLLVPPARMQAQAQRANPVAAQAAQSVRIEATNARVALNQKLAGLRDYKLRMSCREVDTGESVCHESHGPRCPVGVPTPGAKAAAQVVEPLCAGDIICYHRTKTVCDIPVFGKLTVTGPLSVDGEPKVTVKEPNWNDVPVQFVGRRLEYLNCGPLQQQQTFAFAEKYTLGERVIMTKTVEDTIGGELAANVSYSPGSGGGFGGGTSAKVSFSHKVSLSNSKEQSFTTEKNLSESVPVQLPPNSVNVFEAQWRKIDAPISFSGAVVLDASLSSNLEKVAHVSDVLPTAPDREVQFAGLITASAVYGLTIKNNSRPATQADCPAGKQGAVQLRLIEAF